MGARRESREAALQMLYQMDVQPDLDAGQNVERFFGHLAENDSAREFAEQLVAGVHARIVDVDALVQRASKNWRLERMARVDRNILRLAVYELLEAKDVPARVVINEAIEIAKRYGTEESPAFINGILDKCLTELDKK